MLDIGGLPFLGQRAGRFPAKTCPIAGPATEPAPLLGDIHSASSNAVCEFPGDSGAVDLRAPTSLSPPAPSDRQARMGEAFCRGAALRRAQGGPCCAHKPWPRTGLGRCSAALYEPTAR